MLHLNIFTTLQSTEPVANEDDGNENKAALPEAIGATMVDQTFISQGFQAVDTAQSLANDNVSDSDMIADSVRMLMLYLYFLTGQIDRPRPK
jgi:hypothetical protein